MIMFSGMTIIISTLIMVLARPVLTLFSEDQLLLDTTWEMLWYFVPFYFTWTAIDVISGTLKGAGDAVVPVIILGLGICAFRIVWVLLIFGVWSHTLKTLALSYVASWVVTDIALFVRYRQWSNAHKEGIDYSFGK
jgi:Na+-driven multidrug efflux pump